MWWFVPRDVTIPELTADYPFAIARHSTDVIGYNNKFYPDESHQQYLAAH
jgi:hypothetical protein